MAATTAIIAPAAIAIIAGDQRDGFLAGRGAGDLLQSVASAVAEPRAVPKEEAPPPRPPAKISWWRFPPAKARSWNHRNQENEQARRDVAQDRWQHSRPQDLRSIC